MTQRRSARSVTVLALVALATLGMSLSAQAASEDSIRTQSGLMTIRAIHHGTVYLSWNARTVLVDPAPAPGAAAGANVTAEFVALGQPDLILITHEHPDHFSVPILTAITGPHTTIIVPQNVMNMLPAALKAKAQVMNNGEEKDVIGTDLKAVPMYNTSADRLMYHPKGRGNGYVLRLSERFVYFAGDTEGAPELANLGRIDAAFIPMNLPYTQTPAAAAAWVRTFKPTIVYPYHYGMSDVNAFKTQVGDAAEVRLLDWY